MDDATNATNAARPYVVLHVDDEPLWMKKVKRLVDNYFDGAVCVTVGEFSLKAVREALRKRDFALSDVDVVLLDMLDAKHEAESADPAAWAGIRLLQELRGSPEIGSLVPINALTHYASQMVNQDWKVHFEKARGTNVADKTEVREEDDVAARQFVEKYVRLPAYLSRRLARLKPDSVETAGHTMRLVEERIDIMLRNRCNLIGVWGETGVGKSEVFRFVLRSMAKLRGAPIDDHDQTQIHLQNFPESLLEANIFGVVPHGATNIPPEGLRGIVDARVAIFFDEFQRIRDASPEARDEHVQERLWSESLRRVGLG